MDVSASWQAFALSRLPDILGALLPQTSTVYIDLPPSKSKRSFFSSLLPYAQSSVETDASLGKLPANKVKPLAGLVHELRGIKSEAEVRIMKAAADISAKAHAEVRTVSRDGLLCAKLTAPPLTGHALCRAGRVRGAPRRSL